jgi:Family of unknown function (DUF5995)
LPTTVADSRETPEATLGRIAAELAARTRRYEVQRDSRCVFTYCYALLTAQLQRELAASGCTDHGWITDLAVAFSTRYFNALDRYDARDPLVPAAWQRVFDTVTGRTTSVLEDLILGMTAHITADLPHALVAVGLSDAAGNSRIGDYHTVNDILGKAIDPIRRQVGRRYGWAFALDRVGGLHAVVVTNFGIRMARGVAWYNAVRLLDPRISALAAESIQKSTIAVVDAVANPPIWSIRMLLRTWRVFLSFFRRWPRNDPDLGTGAR